MNTGNASCLTYAPARSDGTDRGATRASPWEAVFTDPVTINPRSASANTDGRVLFVIFPNVTDVRTGVATNPTSASVILDGKAPIVPNVKPSPTAGMENASINPSNVNVIQDGEVSSAILRNAEKDAATNMDSASIPETVFAKRVGKEPIATNVSPRLDARVPALTTNPGLAPI